MTHLLAPESGSYDGFSPLELVQEKFYPYFVAFCVFEYFPNLFWDPHERLSVFRRRATRRVILFRLSRKKPEGAPVETDTWLRWGIHAG